MEEKSPLKSLLLSQDFEDSNLKSECDALRRQLIEKKNELLLLEQLSLNFTDFRNLLIHLIQDFQIKHNIKFVEETNLNEPFKNLTEAIPIIRTGLEHYINHHQKLASKFEIEYKKSIFQLSHEKYLLQNELKELEFNCSEAQHNIRHTKRLLRIILAEKSILKRTIMIRKKAFKTYSDIDISITRQLTEQIQNARNALESAQKSYNDQIEISEVLQKQLEERKMKQEKAKQNHLELVSEVEKVRAQLKNESHAHGRHLAELDNAREELNRLLLSAESYHGNLKAQELLGMETENTRLRSVIKVEKKENEMKLAHEIAKTPILKAQLQQVEKRIEELNVSISSVEQKIQTQMMKIPDFKQLHEALDRNSEQTQKYLKEVRKRKYILDEIRDRNRINDQLEMEASKKRMERLKILMPLPNEIRQESQLPKMIDYSAFTDML